MKSGKEYVDLGGDYFDRLNPGRTVRRPTARLERIGYQATLSPLARKLTALSLSLPQCNRSFHSQPNEGAAAPGNIVWSNDGDPGY